MWPLSPRRMEPSVSAPTSATNCGALWTAAARSGWKTKAARTLWAARSSPMWHSTWPCLPRRPPEYVASSAGQFPVRVHQLRYAVSGFGEVGTHHSHRDAVNNLLVNPRFMVPIVLKNNLPLVSAGDFGAGPSGYQFDGHRDGHQQLRRRRQRRERRQYRRGQWGTAARGAAQRHQIRL